ncbi:MAG: AMP-dependent synthetase [Gammaproteobacteria bacterium RIFCSPLOWO2_02_FULL_61_13]|nr:MAG: AMP-dependent synthetase [Gammaproteobacteria bacterium RIFCSPLOWO2_02_FULL_61_13]
MFGRNMPFVWEPTPELLSHTTITAFLREHGLRDYEALIARADADPAWLWDAVLRFFAVRFYRPYECILDTTAGIEWPRWCVGGETNLVLNCLDRHRGTPTWTRTAVIWEGERGERRRLSYAELDAETSRLASVLRALGIRRGDVIALYMPMLPETVAAFFAIAKVGAIAMPLFSGFGPQPIADRLNDGEAKAVITVDFAWRRGKRIAMKETLDHAATEAAALRHVVVLARGGGDAPMCPGRDLWWAELIRAQPPDSPTEAMPAEAPVMLMYTSGTTGRARGTVHTHCGVIGKNLLDVGLCLDLKPTDRWMWMSDMGWVAGPKVVIASTLLGAAMVLAEGAPDYPDPGRQWRLIERHRVTMLGTIPTTVRQLMRHGADVVAARDLGSLRAVVTAGEPWNDEAWLWFFEHVCRGRIPILNYGGGTECGGAILIGSFHRPLKPCAFGSAVPGSGADVVDLEGRPCAPGEVGELVLRKPSIGLTRGLWRDPAGYLESYWRQIPGVRVQGDLARRDEDGLWYMLGRSDDTIKIAGKRTGPAEIEAVLLASGMVAEAAAVGVPDSITGSALVCVCVPAMDANDEDRLRSTLAERVAERFGPPYRPRRVLLVPELPKTRNEKIMRRLVRAVLTGNAPGDTGSLMNPEAVEALRAAVHRAP